MTSAALALILFTSLLPMEAQRTGDDDDKLWFYRVFFNGKEGHISQYTPEELFSTAALGRREKYGIPCPTESDIPVSSQHIKRLTSDYNLTLRATSRWMNTALLSSPVPADMPELELLPFIDAVRLIREPADGTKHGYRKYGTTQQQAEPEIYDPRKPLNGDKLHQSGFIGRNVIIAVLDGGFTNADKIESLSKLRQRGGIIGTRDFINRSDSVYDFHTHGTAVLSILAGPAGGIIRGSAPGARYLLLRTEDPLSEYPVEEDYWIAAAEYADSAGADIITSSLGYSLFDDPLMDYKVSEMDGRTAFITRGAGLAASKGILVVNSAGNERTSSWLHITAPSDGDNVFCIGAVNSYLSISAFSSAGFTNARMIKPDVVAPGVDIPIQIVPGKWHTGSGTSFSCPLISGLSASLMQAVPAATPAAIMKAIRESSDRYHRPDSLYGFGVPDFLKALRLLEADYAFMPEEMVSLGPNPFSEEIMLWFHEPPDQLTVTITGIDGRVILNRRFSFYASRSCRIDGLERLSAGIYFLEIITPRGKRHHKMIKINR